MLEPLRAMTTVVVLLMLLTRTHVPATGYQAA